MSLKADIPPEESQNNKQSLPWKLVHPNNFHNQNDPHVDLKDLARQHRLSKSTSIKTEIQILDLLLYWGFVVFIFRLPFFIAEKFNKNKLKWHEFKCLFLSAHYKRKYKNVS